MENKSARAKVQAFGGFLTAMVIPNIGAFIAWGFIIALFIPTGWLPNEHFAKIVGPMITYLLPVMIGSTGGHLVGGKRGAVMGGIGTIGVIVGAEIPMFLGSMIMGPLGGLVIKYVDKALEKRIPAGFEMVINNFSLGIAGMLLCLLGFEVIGPAVLIANTFVKECIEALVHAGYLPLLSVINEPAKVLFLNNAIDQGVYYPLGMQQASVNGKSIFFMVASNPGPGLGLLLAFTLFGKGMSKRSAPGAMIIHFLGGIHELYFPYVLMKPLTIIAMIAGGMSGTWMFNLLDGGLVLGSEHKRVPDDLENHPVITGHECAGVIVEVGKNLTGKYKKGQRFVLQPAMGLPSGYSAGYSYEYFGGNATYMIIPEIAINLGCVLPYHGSYFAAASLAEPMCCIIGAYHANYHTTQYVYEHRMGVKPGGNIALLACAGPMGIGAIDYAINGGIQPSRVVVVDIDDKRLAQVQKLLPVELAASKGIELVYVNTKGMSDPVQMLRALTGDAGFDDIFVYAAVPAVVEMADELLAEDGCLNFFAGPTDKNFKVPFNFYNVHYNSTHVVGTSGGSTDDMKEAIALSATGQLQPSFMVTHIGGLDAVPETVLNLPDIPGGKKLIYNGVTMPLTAIADFAEKGKTDPLFKELARLVEETHGIWNEQAEKYLLAQFGVDIGEAAQ
ncbi:TPA: zinc-binding dehydrogenase [Escherichia coli]|jgi:mannitol-specific phosphotransferase system IIC component|nr:zinc-binding dehydrogenase [Escherichia coli]